MFKAARELLIEQREEGVIIPTLAFAAALDDEDDEREDDERVRRDRDCLAAAHGGNDWVREATRFSNDYESLTPLGFLDGTLLLRRNTVAVEP
ncbi:MAG: hypothetical protein H0U65_02180 [Rubrobacter sp.]|nr:hypothetical protein [Rubrobacter sp.]